MNFENLPWENGVLAVLATALLGIISDVAYRRWPREMASMRRVLLQQNELIAASKDSTAKEIRELKEKVDLLAMQSALARMRKRARSKAIKPPNDQGK